MLVTLIGTKLNVVQFSRYFLKSQEVTQIKSERYLLCKDSGLTEPQDYIPWHTDIYTGILIYHPLICLSVANNLRISSPHNGANSCVIRPFGIELALQSP